MNIVIKQLEEKNHIYLMDVNMRPCSIDVVDKYVTDDCINELIKKNTISNITLVDQLDLSETPEYFIDRI